jgi:hypothetical protein
MASRLDAVQVALPRAVDTASQQHAAQRQPVVAQEHATQTVRQGNQAREQRTEALHNRGERGVENNLVKDALDQDSGNRPRRRRPETQAAADEAAPPGQAAPTAKKEPPADGKGMRVDLRL